MVNGIRTDVRRRFTSAFRLEDGRRRMTRYHTDLTTFGYSARDRAIHLP